MPFFCSPSTRLRALPLEAVLNSSQPRPNCANTKKDGSAYGSYLRNYADCEKRHKWRLGVRRSAHFVGWMRLCEARARFSNRSS